MNYYYQKVWVSPTEFRILQVRDDGSQRFVAKDHAGFLAWKAVGHTPEVIPYAPPVVTPDDDPTALAEAKRNKIDALREKFLQDVKEGYTAAEMALINSDAINALSKSNPLPNKFTTMRTYVAPFETAKNDKIAQVKACTLVSQVNSIIV